MRDPNDALVGAKLDRDYQVIRRIGVGGMSVVYLVQHTRLHKLFAAKVLDERHASNVEAIARFEIEAKAASQLDHENIVRVTDYGFIGDGRPYIIMELLNGATLDATPLDNLPQIVMVIVSVCRALSAAHAQGVVHRDIKPENIFVVRRSGDQLGVKVLDFGIAKVALTAEPATRAEQTIGTPHFMSPEACCGDEVDHRTDIYAVGVLMYWLFTNSMPHDDYSIVSLLRKQVHEVTTPPSERDPSISPELDAVIMHALAKDPEDRYISIDHLLSEFELALPPGANELLARASRVSSRIHIDSIAPPRSATPPRGTPIGAPPRSRHGTPVTAGGTARRRPMGLVAATIAGLACLGAILVGVVYATLEHGPRPAAAASPPAVAARPSVEPAAPHPVVPAPTTEALATAPVERAASPAPAAGDPTTEALATAPVERAASPAPAAGDPMTAVAAVRAPAPPARARTPALPPPPRQRIQRPASPRPAPTRVEPEKPEKPEVAARPAVDCSVPYYFTGKKKVFKSECL